LERHIEIFYTINTQFNFTQNGFAYFIFAVLFYAQFFYTQNEIAYFIFAVFFYTHFFLRKIILRIFKLRIIFSNRIKSG